MSCEIGIQGYFQKPAPLTPDSNFEPTPKLPSGSDQWNSKMDLLAQQSFQDQIYYYRRTAISDAALSRSTHSISIAFSTPCTEPSSSCLEIKDFEGETSAERASSDDGKLKAT